MRLKIIIIILLFCAPASMKAQFIFQNLRWQDGLSAKEIRCLYKDNDGYLWIGTSNGLNRFDGAVVKQFKNTRYLTSLSNFHDEKSAIAGGQGQFHLAFAE